MRNPLGATKDFKLKQTFVLPQHDVLTSRATPEEFRSQHIKMLTWPCQSQNLNFNEDLCQDFNV